MSIKAYKLTRSLVAMFVAMTVSISVTMNYPGLAVAGVLTGMLFLLLVKSKTKIVVDERMRIVSEKAARAAYGIFATVIGLGSVIFVFWGRQGQPYLESLGIILSYLTLFLITTYSISYHYINRKLGGGNEE